MVLNIYLTEKKCRMILVTFWNFYQLKYTVICRPNFGKNGKLLTANKTRNHKWVYESSFFPNSRCEFRSLSNKMELFAKIVNGFYPLTILTEHSILDVWQDSEYASTNIEDYTFQKIINFYLYSAGTYTFWYLSKYGRLLTN